MRPATPTRRDPHQRARRAGLPVAVVGSIALSLSALPAHAEPRDAAEPGSAEARGARAAASVPLAPKGATATAHKGASFMRAAGAATHAAPKAPHAAPAPATYVVQRGDTVSGIAARFGLRTADVLALNGLGWRSVIQPGQVLVLGANAATTPPPPSASSSASSYVVQRGDTISAIAQRHGLTTHAVLAANSLERSSIIYPGQTLTMPGGTASPAAPAPAPAPSPAPAAAYTVVAGDTMSGIAQRHGVTTRALLAANGLDASSIIYPGQRIAVPIAAVPASAATVPGLDAEQTANAQLIIRVGRELGVPDRGIAIALGTAMQESWIRNLDWGDRDSLGLFQQRPATGWGTPDEVRDPVRSIKAFFGGASDPNGSRTRGLLDIPGWQDMSFADAAQAVQISAYPDRYARWEAPAYAWLAALG